MTDRDESTDSVMESHGSPVGEDCSKDTEYNINRKIFVGNVSYRIKSHKLSKFFRKFGPVEHSYIVKDHLKGWSRGIAFVTFKDVDSMTKALHASQEELILDGREMRVKPAELSNKTTFWQKESFSDGEDDWDESCDQESKSHDIKIQSHDVQCEDQSAEREVTNGVHINDLIDDVLIHIFTMLSFKERMGIERVCWRWKKVLQESWVSVKSLSFRNFFKKFGAGLTDRNLNSALQRCGQYLECLDLSGSPGFLTDFSMDVIGNYSPGLTELDISYVNITDISLKNFVAKCNSLQKVKLNRCIHITDSKGLRPFLQGSPQISHIDLSNNIQITGECFRVAGPTVRSVNLSKCVAVKDSCIIALAKNCPLLEELNLSNCKAVTCDGLKHLMQNMGALKILNVSSMSISDFINAFVGQVKLSKLEQADFSFNTDFNDSCLRFFTYACKNLRDLDISGCDCVSVVGLFQLIELKHLDTLNASFLSKLTEIDVGLGRIAEECKLRKLIVRASTFLRNQGVMRVIMASPNLVYLDLSDCFNITNEIFEAFKYGSVEENKTVELFLGGTSVDWVAEDIDWVTGFYHLKVNMNSLALHHMRPDRDLIVPEMEYPSDDENEYAPHRPISDYLPEGPVEAYHDWEEDSDEFEDYLNNDDPLAAERWDMS